VRSPITAGPLSRRAAIAMQRGFAEKGIGVAPRAHGCAYTRAQQVDSMQIDSTRP